MTYALIPEGFELKKVTKLQKDAVDEYFGREIRGTYLSEFLGNQNTPLLIGGAALVALTPMLLEFIREALADAGTLMPDIEWEKVKKGVRDASLLGGGGQLLVDFFRDDSKNNDNGFSAVRDKYGI